MYISGKLLSALYWKITLHHQTLGWLLTPTLESLCPVTFFQMVSMVRTGPPQSQLVVAVSSGLRARATVHILANMITFIFRYYYSLYYSNLHVYFSAI